ncbi:MAG: MmcQ/YjbR family DNA-binding protein, partial [Actinomycetota bacterium]
MPLPNRVTPLGELIAVPDRGLVYGNRGCLHDEHGRIRRSHAGKRWIACRLRFRGWRRSPLLQPGRFTELFFLDEATAMAAGHRPCALCRRADFDRFVELWRLHHGGPAGADAIDARLHAERLAPGGRVRRFHHVGFDELPDGAFVLRDGVPAVVIGDALLSWTPAGYRERTPRPAGRARLITPPSLVDILRSGWRPLVPFLHPSADPVRGVTIDHVRAVASALPRTTEALVHDRVKFRVGRIVYLAFSRDETVMGFAFPKEERQALVASEPEKFLMPSASNLRYHWVDVRLDAIDQTEMRELVL